MQYHGDKRLCSHVTLGRPNMAICLTRVGRCLFPAIASAWFKLRLCSGRAKIILECSDVRIYTLKLPTAPTWIFKSNLFGKLRMSRFSLIHDGLTYSMYQALVHPDTWTIPVSKYVGSTFDSRLDHRPFVSQPETLPDCLLHRSRHWKRQRKSWHAGLAQKMGRWGIYYRIKGCGLYRAII